MKTALLAVLFMGLLAGDTITVSQLGAGKKIIGALGCEIGEVLEIEGTVLTLEQTHWKTGESEKWIQAEEVNGKSIKPTRILLASTPALSADSIKRGQRYTLYGYESVAFKGIPTKGIKIDFPIWQDRAFGMENDFCLLKIRQ